MLSKTRGMPVNSPAPGVVPDTITGPIGNGAPITADADAGPAQSTAQTATNGETRGEHFRRKAHRTRLHGYAIATVALVAYLIALAATNTAHVKVNWVFGNSHLSLVWLVLFTAILGWLLGLATSAKFHWRTRVGQRRGSATS